MATGGAVVCTDSHGNRDFCVDGENCLMPEPTAAAVGAAIASLLADPDLRARLGEAGRATAQDYTWERRIDELEAFLQAVAAQPRRRRTPAGALPAPAEDPPEDPRVSAADLELALELADSRELRVSVMHLGSHADDLGMRLAQGPHERLDLARFPRLEALELLACRRALGGLAPHEHALASVGARAERQDLEGPAPVRLDPPPSVHDARASEVPGRAERDEVHADPLLFPGLVPRERLEHASGARAEEGRHEEPSGLQQPPQLQQP